jgi:hypothetical protein
VKKCYALCAPVAASLEEAGLDLLTHCDFPKSMWKSLRTTNAIDNLAREFPRWTKPQASFGNEESRSPCSTAPAPLARSRLRAVDGYRELPSMLTTYQALAA